MQPAALCCCENCIELSALGVIFCFRTVALGAINALQLRSPAYSMFIYANGLRKMYLLNFLITALLRVAKYCVYKVSRAIIAWGGARIIFYCLEERKCTSAIWCIINFELAGPPTLT